MQVQLKNQARLQPFQSKKQIEQFYRDILIENKVDQADVYFHENVRIYINDHTYTLNEFKNRIRWLKENAKDVQVELVEFFASSDGKKITDSHISSSIDKTTGKRRSFFVMQQSDIQDGKIIQFRDATFEIGKDHIADVVTSRKDS